MKRYFAGFVIVLLMSVQVYAGSIYIDTLGGIKNFTGSLLYRETRIELPFKDNISLGVVNSTEDGIFSGSLSNWRAGAYFLADLSCCSSMSLAVFAGGSLSGSTVVSTSISFDAGIRAKINDFPLVPLAILIKGEAFSDSANLLGFVGPSLSLGLILKDLCLDLGYSPSYFLSLSGGTSTLYHGASARVSLLI